MDKLSLRIILNGTFKRLVNGLRTARVPQYTTYTLSTLETEATPENVPDEESSVLITDCLDTILLLQEAGYSKLKVVYVGKDEDVLEVFGGIPSLVTELWSANKSALQYTCRLERLIQHLRDAYDAWLYRTWLMSLIDSLPDIVWYKEASGLHNLVNKEFCNTVHKSREDIKDRDHCYIWNAPPESAYQCAETDNAVMSGGRTVVADEKVETDQGMRQFRTYKSPIFSPSGKIIGTVGLGHDVTDFTNMGMELQILTESLPYPAAVADTSWHLIDANSRFCETFDINRKDVPGFDYLTWKRSLKTELISRVGSDGLTHQSLDIVVEKDEARRDFEVTEPDIIDYFDNVSGHYCLFRDVTIDRAFERQTTSFANTDALTGLPNRRRFYEYLRQHKGQPMGVMYLDLDNFKRVNDTYGHAIGDDVLAQVANLLLREIPIGMVARQGGDEFACAIPGRHTASSLQALGHRLHASVCRSFAHLNVGLGCSVGINTTTALAQDPDDFLGVADKLMYNDKARHHAEEMQP